MPALHTTMSIADLLATSSYTSSASTSIASGSYVPTFTITDRFVSLGSVTASWIRVGNIVSVAVFFTNLVTSGGSNTATLSLPIAPSANFSLPSDVLGVGTTNQIGTDVTVVFANTGSSLALFNVVTGDTLTGNFFLSFMYALS